jgi:hypothetical protein
MEGMNNENDINSMVSIEATTASEVSLNPKKVVTKTEKKKIEKKVEKKEIGKEELLIHLNKPTYLETKQISELDASPHSYLVESVKRVTTKYGDAIIATLDDEGNRFKVFLPKRYTNKLSDEWIACMNKTNIRLKYLGGKYHDLEFC